MLRAPHCCYERLRRRWDRSWSESSSFRTAGHWRAPRSRWRRTCCTVRVKEAIEEVDGPDGVLVLMDLGSAVLSAEVALDLLEPAVAGRVRLCSAPLVEGLVAATVAAAAGASIDEVATEATAALAGKQAHLAVPDDGTPVPVATEEPAASAVFVVANEHGLHARPAA